MASNLRLEINTQSSQQNPVWEVTEGEDGKVAWGQDPGNPAEAFQESILTEAWAAT